MAFPFFYISSGETETENLIRLPEDTSKHIVQVLRMQAQEKLNLTDGLGKIFLAEIVDANRKKCMVRVLEKHSVPAFSPALKIAISPIKNNNRFEWFLEKATELGITEITPLICERTEKQTLKKDRLTGILISAMLQSKQCYLPVLHEPIRFDRFVQASLESNKWIAHCEEGETRVPLKEKLSNPHVESLILIGPEGDFTRAEIELAESKNFESVSLGNSRLRTETAGLTAAVLMSQLMRG